MSKSISILFIACSEEDMNAIHNEMSKRGFSIFSAKVTSRIELHTELESGKWDLIISDYAAGQFSFEDAIPLISDMEYKLPLIVFSDHRDEKDMLEAIEKGCSDYILKDDFTHLHLAVCRILKETLVYNGHRKLIKKCYIDNKRLMDTLDSIGDGVITTDKYGNINMLNKVAQSYTGWSQQEALGKPVSKVFRIINKTNRIPMKNPFDKVLKEGRSTGLESNTVLVARDCTEKFVSASCAPIIAGNYGLAGAILVFRDITILKQAEDRIADEQKNLAAMFDAAPVSMLLLDKNAVIKKANNAIYHMTGKDPFTQIIYKEIREIFNCPSGWDYDKGCGRGDKCKNCRLNAILIKACSLSTAIINTEVQYTSSADGNSTKSWLRISTVPVLIDGERHTLVIIDDITGLKQLEEELKSSNLELQETLTQLKLTQNRLIQQEKLVGIGQLAAGVAHEINNPLGFIMSNFDTLSNYMKKYKGTLEAYRDLKNEISNSGNKNIEMKIKNINDLELKANMDFIAEDMKDLCKDTNEGLKRICKIVMGLRLFSQVDQQNDFEEYDLNEGIRNTLIVAQNEIRYHAEVEEDLKDIPTIRANGGQINQILLNIIVNAANAIKSKGTEEMGKIKISTCHDDKFIYCCIEDNGEGIAEENLNRIFDPFFTTKSVGDGMGLGLSISYDIITNKHGGELLVSSTQGIGSSFTIKIPLNE
jgi:PAS domain S-box-containing protein